MLALNRKLAAPQHLRPISRDRVPFHNGYFAWHEPIGDFVQGNTYAHLMENYKKALKAKGLVVEDLKESLDAAICAGMTKKGRSIKGFCVTPAKASAEQSVLDKYKSDPRGPKNLQRAPRGRSPADWKVLHLAGLDGALTPALMGAFNRQIGCGSCRADWMKYVRQHPVQYNGADAQFQWALDAHNYVNAKLSKPIMTAEQAKRIWK
jgi:hypothetical protein